MSDLSTTEQARDYNRPFYFIHIEGFPYIWFTVVPDNWTAPSGWTYASGLKMFNSTNGGGSILEQELSPLGGVVDANAMDIELIDNQEQTIGSYLWSTQRRSYQVASKLVTNNIAANETPTSIETEHAITLAPSNGTLYLGTETMTYTTKTGTTFTGISRGRYAILDDNLEEETWKPAVKWSDALNLPPTVGIYPLQVRGRIVTLYRSFFDINSPNTNTALVKSQSQIRYRGTLVNVQQTPDYLGYIVQIEDIVTSRLEQEIYSRGVGSAKLYGYSIPEEVTQSQDTKTFYEQNYLVLKEDKFDMSSELAADEPPMQPQQEIIIEIDLNLLDTPEDLQKNINVYLSNAWLNEETWAKWWVSLGTDNKLIFETDCVGYYPWGIAPNRIDLLIAKGTTGAWDSFGPMYGVRGSIKANAVASVLGIGDNDNSFISIPEMTVMNYLANFKKWTNVLSWIDIDWMSYASYERCRLIAEKPICKAWMHTRCSAAVPCELDANTSLFVENLPDESPFYVSVPGQAIWRASHLEYVKQEIILKGAEYDWSHPLNPEGQQAEIISVSKSVDDMETPSVKQAFVPTGKTVLADLPNGFQVVSWGAQYILLQFMLSTGTKNYNGKFDILPEGWGLGLPSQYVDVSSFAQLADIFGDEALQRKYVFIEAITFRDLLQEEAQTLGFTVCQRNGRITCIPERLPTSGSVVYTVDASARVASTQVTMQTAPEGIINSITLESNYDCLTDETKRTDTFIDGTSFAGLKQIINTTVRNRGLRSISEQEEATDDIRQMMLDRLASLSTESYLYMCVVNRSVDGITIGDTVYVTDERVANPMTGTRGISYHLGIVQKLTWNEMTGTGELAIRMVYLYHEDIDQYATTPNWNTGNFGPALMIPALSSQTFTFSKKMMLNTLPSNYAAPVYTAQTNPTAWANLTEFQSGDIINIWNPSSGAYVTDYSGNQNFTIQDISYQTNTIDLGAPVDLYTAPTDDELAIMTPTIDKCDDTDRLTRKSHIISNSEKTVTSNPTPLVEYNKKAGFSLV